MKQIESFLLDYKKNKNVFVVIFFILQFTFMIMWVVGLLVDGEESVQWQNLLHSETFMNDYSNNVAIVSGKDPYSFSPNATYSYGTSTPLTYFLYYPLSRMINITAHAEAGSLSYIYVEPLSLIIWIVFLFTVGVVFCAFLYGKLECEYKCKVLLIISMMLSYPMLHSIVNGDLIILSLVFSMFFLFGYRNDNKMLRELSLFSLAISIGINAWPIVFAILLVYEKKWIELLKVIAYSLLLFIIPLMFFYGGVGNIILYMNNINSDQCIRSMSTDGLGGLFSLLGADNTSFFIIARIISYLFCLILIIFGLLCERYVVRVFMLSFIIIILSVGLNESQLVFVIPPFVLLLNDEKKEIDYLALISVFLILQQFVLLRFKYWWGEKLGVLLLLIYFLCEIIGLIKRKRKDALK